jgi:isoamylase
MSEENWSHDYAKSLAVYMNGHGLRMLDEQGQKITDNSFYIIFNAYEGSLDYKLPSDKYGDEWIKVLDTHENCISEDGERFNADDIISVQGRSVVLLKQP